MIKFLLHNISKQQLFIYVLFALLFGGSKALAQNDIECATYVFPHENDSIVGYSNQVSYFPGEPLQLMVNAPDGSFSIGVYREGQSPELVFQAKNVKGIRQPIFNNRPYILGASWSRSMTISTQGWKTGLYNAILQDPDKRCFEVIFVVKNSPKNTKASIAVLASNFTWQAYNDWGGGSFYSCGKIANNSNQDESCIQIKQHTNLTRDDFFAPITTNLRPNVATYTRRETSYINNSLGTLQILQWLEKNQYPYDLITDSDLDSNPDILNGYKIFILDVHSEYWSIPMYDHLLDFISHGGNLISWGGNLLYWRVVRENNLLEVRKNMSRHKLIDIPGGLISKLTGGLSQIFGASPSRTMGFKIRDPYAVISPEHWALKGTGLRKDESFGPTCAGWETDDISPSVDPQYLEVIARSTSSLGQAAMMIYHRPGWGQAFSVGSLAFMSCKDDPVISKIMHNVVENFLSGPITTKVSRPFLTDSDHYGKY